jgi:hypothetical protein
MLARGFGRVRSVGASRIHGFLSLQQCLFDPMVVGLVLPQPDLVARYIQHLSDSLKLIAGERDDVGFVGALEHTLAYWPAGRSRKAPLCDQDRAV